MAEKRSFVLYHDYQQHFSLLNDEQLGKLLRAIFSYEENGTVPNFKDAPALQMCFSFVRAQLDRDREEYEKRCNKNAENGAKGGRPPKPKKANGFLQNPTKAKKADNDNDTVNDTVNDLVENGGDAADSPAPKKDKPIRHKYGKYNNVLLTDYDAEQLKTEFPSDWQTRIERLSEYIATSGKSYKNHAAVVRAWARRDAEKNQQETAAKPPKIYDLSFLEA